MSTPLVSLLVPDVGAPSVGAAVRLAEALDRTFRVEIVGPDLGQGICSMYRKAYPIRAVPCPRLYRQPDFMWESRRLERAVEGDVVVAVKAYRDTVPIALNLKDRRGAKAVVYLDEWDGAVLADLSSWQRTLRRWRQWHHPLEDGHYPYVESLIPSADTVLSTTTFLQRRFGGHVIHMGVDTDWFRPQPQQAVADLRRRLGLEGVKLIVFGGVVRPHKGIEIIPEALRMIGDRSLRLLVVGPVTHHLAELMRDDRYRDYIHVAGAPPDDPEGINTAIHAQMPLYLDLGDLVVLPLLDTPLAQSQMPIKIFEALAMAKPVIGSRVADLPIVLEGCGSCFRAGDVAALAHEIRRVLADPSRAHVMGEAARRMCVEHYSREATRRRVAGILGELLGDPRKA